MFDSATDSVVRSLAWVVGHEPAESMQSMVQSLTWLSARMVVLFGWKNEGLLQRELLLPSSSELALISHGL